MARDERRDPGEMYPGGRTYGKPGEAPDRAVNWNAIVDKPKDYPPALHEHTTSQIAGLDAALAQFIRKVEGKGLSSCDYTQEEKAKLSGIEDGANKTIVDASLSTSSAAADAKKTGDELADRLRKTTGGVVNGDITVKSPDANGDGSVSRKPEIILQKDGSILVRGGTISISDIPGRFGTMSTTIKSGAIETANPSLGPDVIVRVEMPTKSGVMATDKDVELKADCKKDPDRDETFYEAESVGPDGVTFTGTKCGFTECDLKANGEALDWTRSTGTIWECDYKGITYQAYGASDSAGGYPMGVRPVDGYASYQTFHERTVHHEGARHPGVAKSADGLTAEAQEAVIGRAAEEVRTEGSAMNAAVKSVAGDASSGAMKFDAETGEYYSVVEEPDDEIEE